MLAPHENADKFTNGKQAPAEAVKELIFEISCKVDEMQIHLKRHEADRRRASSQESADVNYLNLRNSSPGSSQAAVAP